MNVAGAYLYCSGRAKYFDEEDRAVEAIDGESWRGLHEFRRRYPDGLVHLQGCCVLSDEMVEKMLSNIRRERIDDGDVEGKSMDI